MKITALEVVRVGVNHRGDWLFVKLVTDTGLTGIGEASHGGGAGRDDIVTAILKSQCAPALIGRDPRAVVAATAAIWSFGTGRAGTTAVSACEQALWDLAAQAAELPLNRMLGGPTRSEIPLYANINRAVTERTPQGFAAKAVAAVSEGFQAVKLAPFDGTNQRRVHDADQRQRMKTGLECVAAVRQAVGNEIEVFVDCHSHFDVSTAIEVATELRRLGITWFEEPLPSEDIDGLQRLRAHVPDLQLIGGEELFGVEAFWPYIACGVWDLIMPDIKHCGGVSELLAIGRLARARGISVAPHNPSGPVAMAVSAHVAAAMPEFRFLEHAWGEVPWRADLLTPAERIENGNYILPTGPGLGVGLNEEILAQHQQFSQAF
jgi:galactonate dehydratase